MLIKVFGAAVQGIGATLITIEVNSSRGCMFYLVGLPDSAVKESHQRIISALQVNGYKIPTSNLIVNMAPADIRKEGSAYDLPLAIGLLGAKNENILVKTVPGSFELTFGANQMMENCDIDAIIAIGCVIKGDTPHFDYVCMGATQGITELNATGDIPVIYGLITTNTMEQAEDRAGGKLGNKGDECAITAIKMIDFVWSLNK